MRIDRLAMFVVLCVSLALSGCASSGPSPAEMNAAAANYQLPKQPEAGTAMVYVVFTEEWSGLQFDVHLDGQGTQSAIGYNRGGQYLYFSVLPGEHRIYSREHGNTSAGMGWTAFEFPAKAGDILFLRQEAVLPSWMNTDNRLVVLPPEEGKYYVKTLKAGTLFAANRQPAAPLPQPAQGEISAAGNTFVGTITGGNLTRAGMGFSTPNVKLLVTPDAGEPVVFYVRADSQVIDASGKQLDFLKTFRMYKKRVEIQHFVIRDGTGGQPGRSDFGFEIGQKGVRTMRILDR